MNKTKDTVNGLSVELREPTLDDVVALENLVREQGYESFGTVPQSELQLCLFVVLCVQWGEKSSVTRDELRALPMKCFKEVSEVVAKFRDSFGF